MFSLKTAKALTLMSLPYGGNLPTLTPINYTCLIYTVQRLTNYILTLTR